MRLFFVLIFLIIHLFAQSPADSNNTENNATESFKNTSIQEGKTDTVVVKGLKLEGQVVGLTSESLRFELIYGRGAILISFADIDKLTTQHNYHIFYNGKESEGKIVGINEHQWLITQNGTQRELIEIKTIDRFILSNTEDTSMNNYLHNSFPFITGNVDLKIELENTDPATNELDLSTRIEYARKRDRLIILGNIEHDTKTASTGEKTTSKDEYDFSANYNRYLDFGKENFALAIGGYEHDGLRNIDHRLFGAVGLGHRFSMAKKQWLDVGAGLGAVDDDFGTYGTEHYMALYSNLEFLYTFSDGIFSRGYIRYMPSIFHDSPSWLFRAGISLTAPLSQMLALKISLTDVDDNNPTPQIGNNKLTTDIGLSILF